MNDEWNADTLDGDLPEKQLVLNRHDQRVENQRNHFLDYDYYTSREYNFNDIEVPLLSVGNWGGLGLHLRGNIEGFTQAGSKFKYLRMITGRHHLPFYYDEEVEVQRSFLDAFLKGEDRFGWATLGKVPPVSIVLRKGDVGVNNPEGERTYQRREEDEWPIARTQYTKYWLTPTQLLHSFWSPEGTPVTAMPYRALGTLRNPQSVQFITEPYHYETEITGHIVVHLNVSRSVDPGLVTRAAAPSDIDIFLTLRHISPDGKEIFYTGIAGDPIPLSERSTRTTRSIENGCRDGSIDVVTHRTLCQGRYTE